MESIYGTGFWSCVRGICENQVSWRDSEVHLHLVIGMNSPVDSRDLFSIFMSYVYPIAIEYGIVNWVMAEDACVHTANTAQLDVINYQGRP